MSLPSTMRALRQTSLNGPRDLHLITDAPRPEPGPGQVLIRVTAAGVNYADLSQAGGVFAGGPQPPYLAGIEGAGEIVAVGAGVTGLEPGTHVIGVSVLGGAFAEYLVLPAAAAVPVPAGWADEQALGLVVSWPTALAALKPLGAVAAGRTVLINAAAGGTGQAALAMAKHFGATVIAAAAPEKHDLVKSLGADHVVDSHGGDLAAEVLRLTGGAGADLTLESAGGPALEASLAATKRVTGRVVVLGLAGGTAPITNWDLVYRHPVHLIGLNIGTLIQTATADLRRRHGRTVRAARGRGARPGQADHLPAGQGGRKRWPHWRPGPRSANWRYSPESLSSRRSTQVGGCPGAPPGSPGRCPAEARSTWRTGASMTGEGRTAAARARRRPLRSAPSIPASPSRPQLLPFGFGEPGRIAVRHLETPGQVDERCGRTGVGQRLTGMPGAGGPDDGGQILRHAVDEREILSGLAAVDGPAPSPRGPI